jgi:hypothetical protein
MLRDTREAVFRRMLAREAGTNADTPHIAVAARRLSEELARELTPLIGDLGVASIYARSLHLAQRQCPGFVPVSASEQDEGPISRTQDVIKHQQSAVASEFAVVALTTTVQLLASFIGEGLIASLLRRTWPGDFAGTTEDNPT